MLIAGMPRGIFSLKKNSGNAEFKREDRGAESAEDGAARRGVPHREG